MKYYLELRINEFIEPNNLDDFIRKPLDEFMAEVGNASLAIPEYQSHQSSSRQLRELNFDGKVLYFKYIKVSISLVLFTEGIELVKNFLNERNLAKSSKLVFADERYNLLELNFMKSEDLLS